MTLSRTSRILLGFLLLVLAAFLWVNFLVSGPGLAVGFLRAAPAPTPSQAQTPVAQASTVAPTTESQVARELEIIELPFLVTEPPTQTDAAEAAAPTTEGAAAPEGTRRATVNPFSPVIQQGGAQAEAAAAPAVPAAGQQRNVVTEVPVPGRPTAPAQQTQAAAPAPKAPAPAPVTPGGRTSANLPRALPGGTLGGTPQLLRSAIGATEVPTGDAARVAVAREPEESQPKLDELGETAAASSEPEPLKEPLAKAPTASARTMEGQPPLQAGTSALSRYLRDNNVRFTGSVIGPVSVGVFRSALTSAPVVISLGQTLPDTSIVLTDLRGQQAELALGDSSQTLTLELRR